MKIHSNTGLPQETRKISNNLTLPKGTRERTISKAKSDQKEGNNKDQNGNK